MRIVSQSLKTSERNDSKPGDNKFYLALSLLRENEGGLVHQETSVAPDIGQKKDHNACYHGPWSQVLSRDLYKIEARAGCLRLLSL